MTVKSGFLENGLCFQKFLKRFEGLWKYWILNSKKGTVLSNTELNPFLLEFVYPVGISA